MGTPIFLVKWASNSQDTVDYIVQRAARKNSSGFPGLISHCPVHVCVGMPLLIFELREIASSMGRPHDVREAEGAHPFELLSLIFNPLLTELF